MHSHFSNNASEEGERQLNHGMESNETANAWVHLFHRECCVTASERVDPTSGLDGIGHDFCRLPNGIKLRFLDGIHNVSGVL